MKKSELQNGMICQLNDGDLGIVFLNHVQFGDCIVFPDGVLDMNILNNNLQVESKYVKPKYEIVAVYKPTYCGEHFKLDCFKKQPRMIPSSWEVLWRRDSVE